MDIVYDLIRLGLAYEITLAHPDPHIPVEALELVLRRTLRVLLEPQLDESHRAMEAWATIRPFVARDKGMGLAWERLIEGSADMGAERLVHALIIALAEILPQVIIGWDAIVWDQQDPPPF